MSAAGRDVGQTGGVEPEYEYRPLRLPAGTSRSAAREVLSLYAQFHGWELARLVLSGDGTRQVVLRRKLTRHTSATPGYLPL